MNQKLRGEICLKCSRKESSVLLCNLNASIKCLLAKSVNKLVIYYQVEMSSSYLTGGGGGGGYPNTVHN